MLLQEPSEAAEATVVSRANLAPVQSGEELVKELPVEGARAGVRCGVSPQSLTGDAVAVAEGAECSLLHADAFETAADATRGMAAESVPPAGVTKPAVDKVRDSEAFALWTGNRNRNEWTCGDGFATHTQFSFRRKAMEGMATALTGGCGFSPVASPADAAVLHLGIGESVAVLASGPPCRSAALLHGHFFGTLLFVWKTFGSGNGLS